MMVASRRYDRIQKHASRDGREAGNGSDASLRMHVRPSALKAPFGDEGDVCPADARSIAEAKYPCRRPAATRPAMLSLGSVLGAVRYAAIRRIVEAREGAALPRSVVPRPSCRDMMTPSVERIWLNLSRSFLSTDPSEACIPRAPLRRYDGPRAAP